jgi:predicted acylesterase/phospholipase RssA
MNQSVDQAKKILREGHPVSEGEQLKSLIKDLKAKFEFALGRKILALARTSDPGNTWIIQQMALCTYKDEELMPVSRYADALALLEQIGLRDPDSAVTSKKIESKTLPETLALAGAVYKYKWSYSGQLEDLHHSLAYYRSAWEHDPEIDQGYGGTNAAYILDIFASRSRTIAVRSGRDPNKAEEVTELEEKATKLREHMKGIVQKLSEKEPDLERQYWYQVTMAEIHFGLGEYEQAGGWLTKAKIADDWQRQTTFKQLVSIARLHGYDLPEEETDPTAWEPVWRALYQFLGEDTERALTCYRGKVGLALSGGGFRASLFHLGVLARLAEMDVLRSVEVLSTVSGGSIVGAHYYLEVQKLIQEEPDKKISRQDYNDIVNRLVRRFLRGVQCNPRTRTLSNLFKNIRMIYSKEYSRSHRIGELYEKELYNVIGKNETKEEKHTEPRSMPELLITPAEYKTANEPFKPKFLNWKRRAKVPVLLLNTTSLNSGHSWHFTGRWMGEPPGSVSTDIDLNERYRRLWYEQAPKVEHRNYRLGYAVAASACVPGLFEPLTLDGLYPGRTVRLVDGGVHDNQGVEALLDEGCTLVLCSDASGQMGDQKRPANSLIGVPLRSNGILMDRVREAEYQNLRARVDSHALEGMFFVHMKKGLETLPIDWIDCQDPTKPPAKSMCTTDYGVDKDLQLKLSAIRTDLDSFTEVEAYALMSSGYLMTEHEFKELDRKHRDDGEPGTWGDFDINAKRGDWPFLALESIMRLPEHSSDARRAELGRHLDIGASLVFKVWKLSKALRVLSYLIGATLLLLVVRYVANHWDDTITKTLSLPIGGTVLVLLIIIGSTLYPILKWLRPQQAARSYLWKAVVAFGGWILANIHVHIFDRIFLKYGRLERVLKLK